MRGSRNDEAWVALAGRVDVRTVAGVRERLYEALTEGDGPLVVELTSVEVIDAAGLGMLVAAQQRASRSGRRIVLRGTPDRFARLLRATRLDRVLPQEVGAPVLAQGDSLVA